MKQYIRDITLTLGIVCSLASVPHSPIRECHVAILELNYVYHCDMDGPKPPRWEVYMKQWIGWVYEPDVVIRVDWWLQYQNEKPYKTADGKYILYPKGTNLRIVADHLIETHTPYDVEVLDRKAHSIPRAGLDPPEAIIRQAQALIPSYLYQNF